MVTHASQGPSRSGATEGGARRARPSWRQAGAVAATTDVDQSITLVGLTTCFDIPSSFGVRPSASEVGALAARGGYLVIGADVAELDWSIASADTAA